MATNDIPKAKDLYEGDINAAVIRVQQMTGIEIDRQWWGKHVGNDGSTDEILARFDREYPEEVARRKSV